MQHKTRKLLLILLCVAPLALAACQHQEHRGDSAPESNSSDEHPGDSEASGSNPQSGSDEPGSSSSSEHPGDE